MTMSTPNASGRVRTGVAAVLSTAMSAPAAWAISAAAAMPVTDHSGLAGVSIHTSFVRPGTMAARNASSEVMSTKSTVRSPRCACAASQRRKAQYITRGATTCDPAGRLWNTAAAAAMPEANTREAAPPSSAVINAWGWS